MNQIIMQYEVFAERPEDSHLLVSAVEQHQRRSGAHREWSLPTRVYKSKE